jgi:hypothetical protein
VSGSRPCNAWSKRRSVTKKPHPDTDINNLEMSHRCDLERHRFSQEHKVRSDSEMGFGDGRKRLRVGDFRAGSPPSRSRITHFPQMLRIRLSERSGLPCLESFSSLICLCGKEAEA